MITAVMYHYVRPEENSNLRYLPLADFEKQLDYLLKNYGILSEDEWAAFLAGDETVSGALLTFDDGLVDHTQYVAPVLQRKGLWGQFFICSDPLEQKPLAVHVAHALLSIYPASYLINLLLDQVTELQIEDVLDWRSQKAYLNHDNAADEKLFKRLINWATHELGQRDASASLWEELQGESPSDFTQRWYADKGSIVALSKAGFEIGSHTKTHRLLANLSEKEIHQEVVVSKETLSQVLSKPIESFCFPFGGRRSYNSSVLDTLLSAGFRTAIPGF